MPIATSYDEVPYPRLAFPYTHPSHLATVATLLGLSPAAVDRCAVLELGCAGGANLIPMAYALPSSRFVGVDFSARQIAEGQGMVDALKLPNIELAQMDIRAAAKQLADKGPFDFIIAHGIYSWVPDEVKDALLDACRRLLARNGVAYISYNCYPGCQPRDMIREMTRYHARGAANPREFASSAREFIGLLSEATAAADNPYRAMCRQQLKELSAVPEAVLLHDDLEGDNDPCYFSQFMDHAERHALGYLGDAYFGQMFGLGANAESLEKIRHAGDRRTFEQYLDFLFARSLRTTLLCHAGQEPSGEMCVDGVRKLWISSEARPTGEGITLETVPLDTVPLDEVTAQTFRGPESTVSLTTPLAKAALVELAANCPRPISYEALRDGAASRLRNWTQASTATTTNAGESSAATMEKQLPPLLTEWFATRLIELHSSVPPVAASAGERPVASAVARYQAASDSSVTNLFHRRIGLDGDLARHVIALLDGSHDRTMIAERLAAPILAGAAAVQIAGRRLSDPEEIRAELAKRIDQCLNDLARHALLVEQP